jgi:DNA-binding CsgD family transcriptional regulator
VFEPEFGGPSYFVISLASGRPLPYALSPAEREVVELVLAGLTNVEIASKRERSARTIANQLASIFRKLGVSSRFELTARLTSS